MGDMDAYRDVFVSESTDYLQQVTDGLLALESSPHDKESIEVIFRGAHSLKGMAGAMGYSRTADLTHRMEELMDRVRRSEVQVTLTIVSLMLAAVDLVRDLIVDESAGETKVDPSEMTAALAAVVSAGDESAADQTSGNPERRSALRANGEMSFLNEAGDKPVFAVSVSLESACVLKAVRAYMVLKRLAHLGEVLHTVPSTREIEDEKFDRRFEVFVATDSSSEEVRTAALHVSEVADVAVRAIASLPSADVTPEDHEVATSAKKRELPTLSDTQTVRVSIGHLDKLVDLVGELVILKSRLERLVTGNPDFELIEAIDDLQAISQELRYEIMLTRMVPVGNIFNRFPRMVRDLAVDLDKHIEFRMEGLDIELDRTVLDEIGDPLVHLLRNAIDHGIEHESERVASGKPVAGTVTLSASRERDHVAITVRDDGRGIDLDRVWAKAVERGIVTDQERAEHGKSDILMLTCLAGFSTAETATKVSGRGVGMDVVKGKIEHLGGTLHIRSNVGNGTEFMLRLPLTLAIVQSLLVRSGGQIFALPLSSVSEVFLSDDVSLDTIDGSPVLVMRDGEVITLYRLDSLLHGTDSRLVPERGTNIVLLEVADGRKALHVDGLVDRREIVVKPLSRLFGEQRGFSGATILGDGGVALILDPRTMFAMED